METRRQRRRPVGAPGIVLSLLLALILAALCVLGLWTWGEKRPAPAALTEPAPVRESTAELWQDEPLQSGEAPAAAPAPEALSAGSAENDFEEILYEEDGLVVARIQGKRYKGFIALVEDPMRLHVVTCPYFGAEERGIRVDEMADQNGAILAVNGGGFEDAGGVGRGGCPTGNVIRDGQLLWGGYGSTVGMDANGVLHAGYYSGTDCQNLGLQWALSYGPTLIVDGVIQPDIDAWNEEPRTAVGQRADGTVILLNIQGRQASALGVTCQELAEILVSYGAVTAGNLDGGASSDMYLNGEYINVCNTSGGPRPIPTGLLVMPKEG